MLVLLSPEHAYIWSFDGIHRISAGMITPKNNSLGIYLTQIWHMCGSGTQAHLKIM